MAAGLFFWNFLAGHDFYVLLPELDGSGQIICLKKCCMVVSVRKGGAGRVLGSYSPPFSLRISLKNVNSKVSSSFAGGDSSSLVSLINR